MIMHLILLYRNISESNKKIRTKKNHKIISPSDQTLEIDCLKHLFIYHKTNIVML